MGDIVGHTPGPWHASGSHVWSEAAKDRGAIARCDDLRLGTHITEEERRANARLIAAAPMLLEALIACRSRLIEDHAPALPREVEQATAAISSARGEGQSS